MRHRNGATWCAIPAELDRWWTAAQLFIQWPRLRAWQGLLDAAQARGVRLGVTFLDGTMMRAYQKAAGAPTRGQQAEE